MRKLFYSLALGSACAVAHEANLVELKSADALTKTLKEKSVVVVDFYGTTCPPCKKLHPVFENFAKKYANISFVRIDAWQVDGLGQYDIRGVPLLIFFKNNKEITRISGFDPKTTPNQIETALNNLCK